MNKKLIITRVILILAFVMYLISLLMPYKIYQEVNPLAPQDTYRPYSGGPGYDTEYILFFIFFIPALVFGLVRHTITMKALLLVFSVLLFGFVCFVYSEDFSPDYSRPHMGFFLFFISTVLFLAVAIYKIRIPVPNRKEKHLDLLDDF